MEEERFSFAAPTRTLTSLSPGSRAAMATGVRVRRLWLIKEVVLVTGNREGGLVGKEVGSGWRPQL